MSVQRAEKTLNRAFAEMDQSQGDPEKIRQAAEKGWRAAREATYAVMAANGVAPPTGTLSAGRVGDFESKTLGRPKGHPGGQPLSGPYARAMQVLHGECFYEDKCPADVVGELKEVHRLIEQAKLDAASAKPKRKRSKR